MHAKIRYSSILVFLAIMTLLAGCNRPPSQSNVASQTATATQANDSGANTNATSPPTLSNSSAMPAGSDAAAGGANNAPGSSARSDHPPSPPPMIVPAGTSVVVRLQQSLSSASAVSGERFEAVLDQPLVAENQVIAPVGTPVTGHVTVVRRSGRLHHPGEIGLTLDSVILNQQRVPLVTSNVVARGGSHKKRNWGWIGGGTGGGALIGALAGGGKGALIGGGIGAAAGTTTALLTGKKDVTFVAERRLTFRLHRDVNL